MKSLKDYFPKIVFIIAGCEFLIMALLQGLSLGPISEVLVDTALLSITSGSLIYWLVFRKRVSSVEMDLQTATSMMKASQERLIQAAKLASLGEMAAGVAHELNNPLMFIKGFNGRIRAALTKYGQVSSAEIGDFVDEIESGTERMARIVTHFKDFSRRSNNEVKPVELNSIITRAFDLFTEQLRLRNIEIHLQLSSNAPIIMGDSNRLEQVILNLISNSRDALESTKETLKKIEVSTEVSGDSVVMKFSDNGVGIPTEKKMRIFDPFFTTKETGKGTGLGLSISHGIIMDHGGSISVDSVPGKATTFQISFPLADIAMADEESGQGAA